MLPKNTLYILVRNYPGAVYHRAVLYYPLNVSGAWRCPRLGKLIYKVGLHRPHVWPLVR